MKIREKIRALNRLEKAGLIALLVIALYTLIGFFALPPVFKMILQKRLSERLNREVTIRKVGTNPYALSLSVSGLNVKRRNSTGALASFDNLYLNLHASSIIRMAFVLEELKLTNPYLQLIRTAPGRYNISDLLQGSSSSSSSPAGRFSINNILVLNGKIRFEDVPEQERHLVDEITLAIPFISNMEADVDIWVKPRFTAVVNGSPFVLTGETRPFSKTRETDLDIRLTDIDIPNYLSYLPGKRRFDLRSALLDLNMTLTYRYLKQEQDMKIAGDMTLKKLDAVDENGTSLLTLPKLEVHIDSFQPLKKRLHISKILASPFELAVRREKEGAFNLTTLLEFGSSPSQAAPDKAERGPGFAITLDTLRLNGGEIDFTDYSVAEPFKTTLKPVSLEINHFNNTTPGAGAGVTLSMKAAAGGQVDIQGEFSLAPFSSAGALNLTGLPVPNYAPYYKDLIRFDVGEAILSLKTGYRLVLGEKREVVFSDLSSSVESISFRRKGEQEDFMRIASMAIRGGELDLEKRNLTVQDLRSTGGFVKVTRSENGEINLENLFPRARVAPGTPAGEETESDLPEPWNLALADGQLTDYTIEARDRSVPDSVDLKFDQLALGLRNFSNIENRKGGISLSFRVNEKGKASLKGEMGLGPLSADLEIDLEDIGLMPGEPYLRRFIKAQLTGGDLSMKGNLLLGESPGKKFGMSYLGDVMLSNVSTLNEGKDFLKWKTLSASGMDYGNNPHHMDVQGVALDGLFMLIQIDPQRNINILDVLNQQEEKGAEMGEEEGQGAKKVGEEEPRGKRESFGPIEIQKCVLSKGRIDFNDNHIQPGFHAVLTDLEGTIVGLSTEGGTEANVDIKGKMDEAAPLVITGKISPLGEAFRADMEIDLNGMDMTRLTPYSGKYIGYTIDKGNLSLELKYRVVRKKLESDNRFILNQLDFGKKVESDAAISIPIKLAVGLLKNREGQIKLDIPVSGDLGSPQFHLGKVILSAVRKFISKAITSPFSFLASIVGWKGTELRYVVFSYGSSDISEEAAAKLDKIAEALYDRPELEVDLKGYADTEQDRRALRWQSFLRELKQHKLKEMVRSGQAGIPLEQVEIGPEEYDNYLRMAYKAQQAEGKGTPGPPAEDLSRSQMESAILSKIEVTDNELKALAQRRAVRVRQYILAKKDIEAGKIYLVTPESLSPGEQKEVQAESRVEMGLK